MEDRWVSDAEYERLLGELGRLEWARRAIDVTHFEAVDEPDPALRVRYVQAGTALGPNCDLAEVVCREENDVIEVALFERAVCGVYPDGSEASEKLAAVTSFVEIGLQGPLGDRAVIDAMTGARLQPRDVNPALPARRRYGPRGCPRWLSQ
jgi:hypothetical protein